MLSSPATRNSSLLYELDDEDANLNTTIAPNAHEFLNFSRRITERSLKRPVDAQIGIAYGKDILFSHRNQPLKNTTKISSPLTNTKNTVNATLPTHTTTIHSKLIPNKTIPIQRQTATLHLPSPPPLPSSTSIGKGSSLEVLVADVLNYIESCPDQLAYSYDLAKLKPKLEAIRSGKTR
ncbi:hypothetical protein [Parasitella parasitica]|uniref:Uncharacterized protein n=1 Tax=Parasitella parasitica TaxID=35722 RepID=A0A0B7NWK1_9FUNG|nr:hypothetical protein [Parasitella parasitica]